VSYTVILVFLGQMNQSCYHGFGHMARKEEAINTSRILAENTL
jgi:hypothetical protein